MKKKIIALFVLLILTNLSWAEERGYTTSYSTNSYITTLNFTNSSAASAGARIGTNTAMQAQNNLNAFRNSIRQQTQLPYTFQPPQISYTNLYPSTNQNTQNLNTYLDYSDRLKKLKNEALTYDYLKDNPSDTPVLDLEKFNSTSGQIMPLPNSQTK